MSVFDTSSTTTTTLPSWFSTAQQDIAKTGSSVYGATPPPGQTSLAGLSSTLQGSNNPFTGAMSSLSSIGQNLSNPWLPSGAPDTSTALGGLFAAQNAKLDQILPSIAAKEGAAGIGSGNYGSLRGETAVDTARAGALTDLTTQQNQAALNAQQQAIQAEQGIGNIGAQYGTTATTAANAEMLGGLPSLAKYSDIINQMGPTADKTAVATTSGSQYDNAIKAMGALFGNQGITATGLNILGGVSKGSGTGLSWLDNLLSPSTFGTTPTIDQSQSENPNVGPSGQAGYWDTEGNWVTG